MINGIKVCTGPGCKAWDSEKMAKRLKKMRGTPITLVKCMDKCGGGASIRFKERGKIFKVRDQDGVNNLIKGKLELLNEAC